MGIVDYIQDKKKQKNDIELNQMRGKKNLSRPYSGKDPGKNYSDPFNVPSSFDVALEESKKTPKKENNEDNNQSSEKYLFVDDLCVSPKETSNKSFFKEDDNSFMDSSDDTLDKE